MNQPNHGDNSVYRRLSESTSGTVRCALTFETVTVETVDVAAKLQKCAIPPVLVMKHIQPTVMLMFLFHHKNTDDEFVDPPLTETGKVYNSTSACDEKLSGDEKDTGESDDAVLVTPPKQYNKHNRVIEADDVFVDPPLTEPAKVCNSTSACDEKLSGDEKETRESDDVVLATPPKEYNKHNRVIEADDEFVDPPIIQTTDGTDGVY
ncbi:hypothetical protein F2Q70_00024882 [Brassica cretica]|uniref:Uncharacterized protein n=1 Tax=Brassica cretica TaxID=69181 RepID=A0A8S9LC97_BRACR|nr:hypothetical protein F2Q70_00024882 [Brassica cretica]